MKKAFLFAGQGAQTPGMACELTSPRVKELFDIAESVRSGIVDMIRNGDMATLSQTVNTQPCMFVADLAYAYAAEESGGKPDAVCGFSVGEIPALTYAGVFSVEEGMRVIIKRAELMREATEKEGGAMIAALRITPDKAEEAAKQCGGAWAANYNSPEQTVIAVTAQNEGKLTEIISAMGGRAIKLKVSGAFHCPILNDASEKFGEFLRGFGFRAPSIPVYANLTALPYASGDEARATLSKQMCSPVRFTDTVKNMVGAGITEFTEVGPGKVLTGLVGKILPSLNQKP